VNSYDTAASGQPPSGTRIQSVARASQLLLWIAEHPEGAAVREIAESQGLLLPTVYHMVNTLLDEGLLAKDDATRRYILGDAIAILVQAYLRTTSISERLRNILKELASCTGETVYAADWGADDIRVLGSVEGSQTVRVAEVIAGPGAYQGAHARANGKVLLAYAPDEVRDRYLDSHELKQLTPNTITSRAALERELAAIRRRGLAYDAEEFLLGVSCVAAPLRRHGSVVAAIGILAPTDRFKKTKTSIRDMLLKVIAQN
jgi:IclR family transcriptional regulator, acetate operon repressor